MAFLGIERGLALRQQLLEACRLILLRLGLRGDLRPAGLGLAQARQNRVGLEELAGFLILGLGDHVLLLRQRLVGERQRGLIRFLAALGLGFGGHTTFRFRRQLGFKLLALGVVLGCRDCLLLQACFDEVLNLRRRFDAPRRLERRQCCGIVPLSEEPLTLIE
jgi:hypothetical protein